MSSGYEIVLVYFYISCILVASEGYDFSSGLDYVIVQAFLIRMVYGYGTNRRVDSLSDQQGSHII